MNCTFNPRTATAQELLKFYNDNNSPLVKRFSDRKTAERRCQETADRLNAAHNLASIISTQWAQADAAKASGVDHSASNARIAALVAPRHPDAASVHGYDQHGQIKCPHCGTHLSNGVGTDRDEVNGRVIRHNTHQFACLGCGEEFGPVLSARRAARPVTPVGPRPQMVQSLKLDRRIVCVDTGAEYKNACQVWKAGLVSASQGDRLSALLYGAAKRGEFPTVTVNGHAFKLLNGGAA
jgi:hypothetical protein